MKLLSAYLLTCLVFFSGTKNLFFLVDYQVNRNYYELVCENQNRPELNCHGKCQINKDTQKTTRTFSFSHFTFDFYENEDTIIPHRIDVDVKDLIQISEYTSDFWYAVFQRVPNPPPVS